MKRSMRGFYSLMLVGMSAFGLSVAADQMVAIPTAWRVCPYFFAASPQAVAVVLFPSEGDPFVVGSRVLQVRGNTTVSTDISGKVFAVEYSPDGHYLLVRHEDSSTPKATLVSETGVILWSKSDKRIFAFSGSGEVLYAIEGSSGRVQPRRAVETFNVQGESQRLLSASKTVEQPTVLVDPTTQTSEVLEPGTVVEKSTKSIDTGTGILQVVQSDSTITAAAVLGNGDKVIVLTDGILKSIEATSAPIQLWSSRVESEQGFRERNPLIASLRPLGANRMILTGETGRFKVIRSDGTVEYTYSPSALDAADATRSFVDYASSKPFSTSDPTKLLLFRGTADAFLLDLSTGTLSPVTVNVTAPEGFTLIPDIVRSSKMLFYSSQQVLIRDTGF